MKQHYRTIAVGSVGNIMEWFDFSIYGYFAPVIARVFFPAGDHFLSLLATLGIFASGFLMRPLGAAYFGHLGDTRGRSRALVLSVVLMAVPTCLMGFLPTYAQAGIWAPVMLTLLRLIQGFSVGGELTGSITYMAEQAPAAHRGFFTSFATFGTVSGFLLGSLTGAVITENFSEDLLFSWGWRTAFWCGILLGAAIFIVRRGLLADSPSGTGLPEPGGHRSPVREVLSQHRPLLARIFGIASFIAVSYYMITVYLSTFLSSETHLPLPMALKINTLAMGVLIVLVPLMGALSDRWGRKPLMLASSLGFVLLSYPLFHLLSNGVPWDDLMAQLVFVVLIALYEGTYPALLAEICPARVRMTAFSLSFNLSMAVLGGTTPLVATLLIRELDTKAAPSFYLILVGLVCFLVTLGMRETKDCSLSD
ncbi:MAG: MFS transporter [Deltaproteobacteria bacterium]|nr:MFS transporter [Deltaproteobacteria bacterium]